MLLRSSDSRRSGLANAYRRALGIAGTPMYVQSILIKNSGRGRPLPETEIWRMAARFIRNTRRVETASRYREHLIMAADIIGMSPDVPGSVVECGSYKGGSAVNLSLACSLAGRELHVFDSFEGLPAPVPGDADHRLPGTRLVNSYEAGMYAGRLEEVMGNVRTYGAIDVCHFHKGWFDDTMPGFEQPCIAAFVDVDLRSSLETCVRGIWPQLADGGVLYIHEAPHYEMASLFFDREWWRDEMGSEPPGLVGAGSGVGLDAGFDGWKSDLGYALKLGAADFEHVRG